MLEFRTPQGKDHEWCRFTAALRGDCSDLWERGSKHFSHCWVLIAVCSLRLKAKKRGKKNFSFCGFVTSYTKKRHCQGMKRECPNHMVK